MALALALGIVAPRLLLKVVGSRFNTAIQRGTPDMIDLLIICSEAGMGLESALERVAQEMGRSNAPMSKVLNWLLDDLRMLPNRRDAFGNLASRTTSEGLRRFGTMVNQSLQYGTPLGDALRAIAEELRRDRMTSLEERAHKLGAKLIVPMVIFILPAMFVTLAGSSFLHLIETFKNIGHLH
jgi:tight adherence protein C